MVYRSMKGRVGGTHHKRTRNRRIEEGVHDDDRNQGKGRVKRVKRFPANLRNVGK